MPKTKLRYRLTTDQRFVRVLEHTPKENPIFPTVMHSIERYLDHAVDLSKTDEVVRGVIAQHPEITREMLRSWVKTWRAVPAATKKRHVYAEFAELSAAQKLNTQELRVALNQVITPPEMTVVVRESLWSSKTPQIPKLQPVPAAVITAITPTDPDGYPYITLGQPFKVYGSGFSTSNNENQIIIFRMIGEVAQPGIAVTPTSSQADTIEAIAPIHEVLGAGNYVIYLAVQGKGGSNLVDAYFAEPLKPAATITSVMPPAQNPGKTMVINGDQFAESPRIFWRIADPALGDVLGYYYTWTEASWESAAQVTAVVPTEFLGLPGDYLIAVAGKNQALSNWYPFTVRSYTYQVQFTQMKCIDESDPEVGGDEIVTRWAIATGNQAWIKATGQYKDFDDGTVKSYNAADSAVFPTSGGIANVIDYLLVMTTLYEWDEDDAKAATNFIADLGKAIGSVFFGGKTGEWMAKVIGYLEPFIALFGGDPDFLGENTLKWSAAELRDKTNNPLRSFTGTLDFLNDDDTGSYQLSYRVARGEGE